MNDKDRRTLESMDTRELADIGISRSDLPRLFAERSFSSRRSAEANRGRGAESPARSGRWRRRGNENSIIKAGLVVSAACITWAIVCAVTQGFEPAQVSVDDGGRPGDAAAAVAWTEPSMDQPALRPFGVDTSLARGKTS